MYWHERYRAGRYVDLCDKRVPDALRRASADAPADVIRMSSTTYPVNVITGFLGSGKTTLLSVLCGRAGPGETAVIINEVADIALDQIIVGAGTSSDVDVVLGGCICCDVQKDLVGAMHRLAASFSERPPAQVFIETTGLADPTGVAEAIDSDASLRALYSLGQVITVVDSLAGLHTLRAYAEARAQVLLADKVVLSKVGLAESRDVSALRTLLDATNPIAPISEWRTDEGIANFCDLGHVRVPAVRSETLAKRPPLRHEAQSSSFFLDQPLTQEAVSAWTAMLAMFLGKRLLRVKALLNVEGIPTVVQGAQQFFYPATRLPAWPTSDRRSQIVFISDGLHRSQLLATFDAFELGRDRPRTTALRHGRYGKFVEIAARVRHPS